VQNHVQNTLGKLHLHNRRGCRRAIESPGRGPARLLLSSGASRLSSADAVGGRHWTLRANTETFCRRSTGHSAGTGRRQPRALLAEAVGYAMVVLGSWPGPTLAGDWAEYPNRCRAGPRGGGKRGSRRRWCGAAHTGQPALKAVAQRAVAAVHGKPGGLHGHPRQPGLAAEPGRHDHGHGGHRRRLRRGAVAAHQGSAPAPGGVRERGRPGGHCRGPAEPGPGRRARAGIWPYRPCGRRGSAGTCCPAAPGTSPPGSAC
jgi:hypothetical protein